MLNNIVIGKYVKRNSFFHERHPLLKILIAIFLIVSVLAVNIVGSILIGGIFAAMILISKLPIMTFVKALKGIRWILYFLIFFFVIFRVDLYFSILKIYQLIIILFISIWMTSTTSLTEMTYGLEKLFSPLKLFGVNVSSLAFILSLALRFIPMIQEKANKILKSQASRGVDYYTSSIPGKIIIMKSIIIPLFVTSLRTSDELGDALTVKFYKIGQKRVYTKIKKWSILDSILLLSYGLVLIIIYLGVKY